MCDRVARRVSHEILARALSVQSLPRSDKISCVFGAQGVSTAPGITEIRNRVEAVTQYLARLSSSFAACGALTAIMIALPEYCV